MYHCTLHVGLMGAQKEQALIRRRAFFTATDQSLYFLMIKTSEKIPVSRALIYCLYKMFSPGEDAL